MKLSRAVARQRKGVSPKAIKAAIDAFRPRAGDPVARHLAELAADRHQAGVGAAPKRPYSTANRPRRSPKTSGSQDVRYGSYAWKQLRAKILRERPNCEGRCGGHYGSRYADHVIEVKDDTSDANFYNESNIQALCPRCHGVKTAEERARRLGKKYRRREVNCGVDPATGLPISPDHWWNK